MLVAVIVVVCIIAATVIYLRFMGPLGARAKVAAADDRAYFTIVHDLLSSAEESIDVILYQSRFYFHYPVSKSNTLLTDLVEASDRGLRVRAVIEQADWNIGNSEENRDVWNVLRQADIELYFDPVGITSHSKLVIIDGRYVAVGSTNWSHYSMDINNEANVVVDSRRVAGAFTDYFEDLVAVSNSEYTPAFETITADRIDEWEERYAIIKDVADSADYDPDSGMGRIYMGDLLVGVIERPLEQIMAIDSLFFSTVQGESVRVVGRVEGRGAMASIRASDVEKGNTLEMMARAVGEERARIRTKSLDKVEIGWTDALRVVAVPNELYAPEVRKLIRSATDRIWIAMLDARYYEETPRHATKTKGPDETPSFTNDILGDLLARVADGIDVRLVCDMGWQGSAPPSKTDFLRRLSAGGAQVYEDVGDITTHAKILIVDDSFAVVGSTNWSYYALEENNETAVIVESPEINAHYAAYIESVMEEGSPFSIGE
jgi:phosphatidylserine/phosphatidylglycerophosphate/cardiolipin synthase-like enzyme